MAAKQQLRGLNGVEESPASVEREGELGKTPPMRLCGVKRAAPAMGIQPGKAAMARRAERLAREQTRENEAQETISVAEVCRRLDWIQWRLDSDWDHCEDVARKAELGKLIAGLTSWRNREGKPWEGR